MIDAAGARRARRPVRLGRQLPRGAARPGLGRRRRWAGSRCASTWTSCSPARCWSTRPTAVRAAACRPDPLRDAAAVSPRPRPSGGSSSAPRSRAADRRGATRVGGLRRAGRPGPARAGRAAPLRGHAGDPRRDRPGRARLRRHRAAAQGRRLVPVRRPASAARALEFPTADGKAHFSAVPLPDPIAADGQVRRLDPARQAVQLDGPGARRRDHRGGPRRGPDQPPPTPRGSASPTATR